MASYNVVANIDGFLHQLMRLVGSGYYFYYQVELEPGKNTQATHQRIIQEWGLEIPYWKREKRRRGQLPSIWMLAYDRHIIVLSTYGRTKEGEPHRFFIENEERLYDIRRHALYFCGYSIRYPISKETGKRKLFVRLEKEKYLSLKARLCRDGIRERFRDREVMEAEFSALPYQPYGEVYRQLRIILEEVNKRRKYKGFKPLHLSCVPSKMRPPSKLKETRQVNGDGRSEAAVAA